MSGASQLRDFPSRLNAVSTPRPILSRAPGSNLSRSLDGQFDLLAVTANTETPVEDLLPPHNSKVTFLEEITASEEPSTSQSKTCEASTDYLATPSQDSSRLQLYHPPLREDSTLQLKATCVIGMDSHIFVKNPTPHFPAVRPTNTQSGLDPSSFPPASFSSTDIPPTRSDIPFSIPLTYPTPALRVGTRRTRTSHVPPSPSPDPVSAQIQIASEVRSRLRGYVRKRAAWRQSVERRSTMRYANAICRRLRIGSAVRLRYTTLRDEVVQLHAYIQYLTQALQVYAGAFSSLSTRMLMVPALVASPLPGPVHPITHQPHNPVLDNTRGLQREREVQDDEVVRNPVMDVLPLFDEVVSAILKRLESLVTDIQPRSPQFSSLPGTETEEPNKQKSRSGGP
ncbi:hypothetical protein EDB87DRAFT_1682971 [Lactarius vividus]|nr:hypothetical protein EDB87DRAFT_1682971 [Lactarius vividus]